MGRERLDCVKIMWTSSTECSKFGTPTCTYMQVSRVSSTFAHLATTYPSPLNINQFATEKVALYYEYWS